MVTGEFIEFLARIKTGTEGEARVEKQNVQIGMPYKRVWAFFRVHNNLSMTDYIFSK